MTDKDALEREVRSAAASPLVQHALVSSDHPRLTPVHHLAVRAVGRLADGSPVGVTILPYVVDGDVTHATFISLIDGGAAKVADVGELIVGREPTPLETGFLPVNLGSRIGWVKGVSAYRAAPGGEASRLSPAKWKWAKFVQCFFEEAPGACAAGKSIGETVAPGVPRAGAIGCGIGVAGAAVGCAAEHLFS